MVNPYTTTIVFVPKMLSAAYIQAHFRLDFFMEANNMNRDQTAPKAHSDLGPYCLQYRLPKNIFRKEEQMTKVVTSG